MSKFPIGDRVRHVDDETLKGIIIDFDLWDNCLVQWDGEIENEYIRFGFMPKFLILDEGFSDFQDKIKDRL